MLLSATVLVAGVGADSHFRMTPKVLAPVQEDFVRIHELVMSLQGSQ